LEARCQDGNSMSTNRDQPEPVLGSCSCSVASEGNIPRRRMRGGLGSGQTFFQHLVTFAGSLLEALAVENRDHSPAIADKTRALEPAAATETLGRLIPSIIARNSWVSRNSAPPLRSCVLSNHLAQRSASGCSALQAADWAIWSIKNAA
jgi:hypothetical protein